MSTRPTLDEARAWGYTTSVTNAARVLGISKGTALSAIKNNRWPADLRPIEVGRRKLIPVLPLLRRLDPPPNHDPQKQREPGGDPALATDDETPYP